MARKIQRIVLFGLGSTNWLGGLQYITNLIRALDSVPDNRIDVVVLIDDDQRFEGLDDLKNISLSYISLNDYFPPWSFTNRVVWFLQRKFQKRIAPRFENRFLEDKVDFAFPIVLTEFKGRFSSAGWIADFQYHFFPDGASPEVTQSAYNEISFIANNAAKVVLSSEVCKQDCEKLFPVTNGKNFVLPFNVYIPPAYLEGSDFEGVRRKYALPSKFLMVSNLFAPTKNHLTLFRAIAVLQDRGVDVHVICTGNIVDQRNVRFGNEIIHSLAEWRIRHLVHLLGIIPRKDQVTLYRMSTGIVQPSLNEGWSTSVEEAKALGKSLVMSDIDVHKEQYPNNPYMFRGLDVADMADKIEALWTATADKTFPDPIFESLAYKKYQQELQQFGKRFLDIAIA